MKFLHPDIYVKNIRAVPYDRLLKRGINTLVFDIDNTLVPFDRPEADSELVSFIEGLKNKGFTIALLSNNDQARVELFNQKLDVIAVYSAKKPNTKGINEVLQLAGVYPEQAAIIGDQIFTDIWCGNRKGMTTILTRPVETRDNLSVYCKRGIERLIVKGFVKKVKKHHEAL